MCIYYAGHQRNRWKAYPLPWRSHSLVGKTATYAVSTSWIQDRPASCWTEPGWNSARARHTSAESWAAGDRMGHRNKGKGSRSKVKTVEGSSKVSQVKGMRYTEAWSFRLRGAKNASREGQESRLERLAGTRSGKASYFLSWTMKMLNLSPRSRNERSGPLQGHWTPGERVETHKHSHQH